MSAFQTVGNAVGAATSGDEIWVASGTYVENIVVSSPLTILGGFAGDETHEEKESRNPKSFPTVVDGNRAETVVTVQDKLTLDGITIRNGKSSKGSGVKVEGGELTIKNSILIGNGFNNATSEGGAIYSLDSIVTIERCTILGNAASFGGGISVLNSTAIISHCRICENESTSFGGGIDCSRSAITIDGCLLEGNKVIADYHRNSQIQPKTIVITSAGALMWDSSQGIVSNTLFVK
ncbi:MAG: DUF1565 domain-containing protein, partial [Candidatus Omnitrophica bacterium]|nr:DUF1565 domain-containing protein [Candidatus Omnitrophota bacterium]